MATSLLEILIAEWKVSSPVCDVCSVSAEFTQKLICAHHRCFECTRTHLLSEYSTSPCCESLSEGECGICRFPFVGESKRTLHCGHSFCYHCLSTCVLENRLHCQTCGAESSTSALTLKWDLNVKKFQGPARSLKVHGLDSVASLYSEFSRRHSQPLGTFQLRYLGELLSPVDLRTLRSVGLDDCTTIEIIYRPPRL